MSNLLPILATVALVTGLQAQFRFDAARIISKSDLIYPALDEHRGRIGKRYDAAKDILPSFTEWVQVPSPAAARLFPSLRFAAISWSENAHPEAKGRAVSLADGLHATVGVHATNRQVQVELLGHGNCEDYGRLLSTHRVRIQNAADARMVWEAFCDLHFKHWQGQPAVKVSETVWHLGDVTIGRFHYYCEVLLDEHQTVQSAKLHADKL